MADTRLHSQIAWELTKNKLPPVKVLDFGCGEGALTQRLIDLGYEVVSTDIDEKNFKASGKFEKIDFNSIEELSNLKTKYSKYFDVVISSEVIEHIENLDFYLKTIAELLKEDGFLIITTPNISSWRSRLYFLIIGLPMHFLENSLRNHGHINPITLLEISELLKNKGFTILSIKPAGLLPRLWIVKNPKQLFLNLCGFICYPFMKGIEKNGWCLLISARKNA